MHRNINILLDYVLLIDLSIVKNNYVCIHLLRYQIWGMAFILLSSSIICDFWSANLHKQLYQLDV